MRDDDRFTKSLRSLHEPLTRLLAAVRTAEAESAPALRSVAADHLPSARNLVHYLALRRHDLRELQDRLASVGLSSLGRAEPCVEATLLGVLELVARGAAVEAPVWPAELLGLDEGRRRLRNATERLLGDARGARRVRIMVTLPSEAADDAALIAELVKNGMDTARINCAHDGPLQWEKMIEHVRRAAREQSVACRVLMDLPGPKLRTGALAPGPRVLKLEPRRDASGHVLQNGRAWLGLVDGAPAELPRVPVPIDFVTALQPGDTVRFVDARDKHRQLQVIEIGARGAIVETAHTAYVPSGARLIHRDREALVGELAPVEQPLILEPGDTLVLTRDPAPASAGPPARIACTLPSVFADVRPGDRIWLDDGAIGGRIRRASIDELEVTITDAKPHGSKLRGDKGINLPDTHLALPPFDDRDGDDLAFVAAHADLVGFSFVRRPSDVTALHDRLTALGRPDLGVVLKIETREGFENLPSLLLAAMQRPLCAVMIARGDLAVECGWERLAELQEEILWICEAAHLPVIWATQVLESLAKKGRPSRAEITDAAMSQRAECVMLNKGPHLVEAVQVLDDILLRMESHQTKKRSMMRPLALAEHFARRR